MNTILQIPIDIELRKQAVEAASNLGFSSLQESIRVFITQLVRKEVTIGFQAPSIKLSPQAINRYNRIAEEIEDKKVKLYKANDTKQLMRHLTNLPK